MAIKFQTNKPLTVIFPYGDFMEVSGQYGTQFLYTVEVDGVRDRLYTTPKLHQKLQDEGIEAGSMLTITKIEGEGNRLDWKIEDQSQNGHAEVKVEDELHAQVNGETNGAVISFPSNTGNGHQQPVRPDFDRMDQLLDCCLKSSLDAWNGLDEGISFSSEDVRAVGITLFIECARKGVEPLRAMEQDLSL
jgi:hypothetical protein